MKCICPDCEEQITEGECFCTYLERVVEEATVELVERQRRFASVRRLAVVRR